MKDQYLVPEEIERDFCFCTVEVGCGAHHPAHTLSNESFLSPRVKRSERECDRLPPVGAFVNDTSNYKSTPPYVFDSAVLK